MVLTDCKPNRATNRFVRPESATGGNRPANVFAVARTVGDLIAEARSRAKGYGRRGMSQMDLARAIGMDNRSWLAQVEAGNIEKPAPERLQAIADVLPTVSFRDLLAASDQLDVLAQPAGESKPQPTAPAPDLAALIAAMTAQAEQQTKAMAQQAQLITLLTEQNAMLKQLVFGRPAAPGHFLTAPASLQAAESAALELGALDLRAEQERDQPAEPRAGAPRGTGRSGTHPR